MVTATGRNVYRRATTFTTTLLVRACGTTCRTDRGTTARQVDGDVVEAVERVVVDGVEAAEANAR